MVDVRLSRIVKVKVALSEGEATVGTGYLLAPGVVVTAHHVVKAAPGHARERGQWREASDYPVPMLRVRLQGHEGASLPVAETVTFDTEGIDAAVLLVPELSDAQPSMSVGARLVGHTRPGNCRVYGFPEASAEAGTVPLTYVTADVLPPVGGVSIDRLSLQVTTPEPRVTAEWGGISGAAVVDGDGQFHGLVTMASGSWQSTLHALPVAAIRNAARSAVQDGRGETVAAVKALEQLAGLPIEEIDLDASLFDPDKTGPRLTRLAGRSYFALLHHKNRVVDFVDEGPHAHLRDRLLDWARDGAGQPDLRVLTLTGEAGTGKSRLAAAVCGDLADGEGWWQAGFADLDRLATAPRPQAPLLVVIDYAERHTGAVGAYLKTIQRLQLHEPPLMQAPVRVLLVSRAMGPWYDRILAGTEDRNLVGRSEVRLARSDFGTHERRAHARAAYAAFAAGRGNRVAYPQALDAVVMALDRPLTVHIAALLAADGDTALLDRAVHQPSKVIEEGLLDALLDRESQHWTRHHRLDPPLDIERGKEALAVATLTAPAFHHYPDLLGVVPAFAPDATAERRFNIAEALCEIYPGPTRRLGPDDEPVPHMTPVEPDLLGSHLLHTTGSRKGIIERLVAHQLLAEHHSYSTRLLHALSLAADAYPAIRTDLEDHLAAALATLIDADKEVASGLTGLLRIRLPALVRAAVACADRQQPLAAQQLSLALALPKHRDDPAICEAAAETIARGCLTYPHAGITGLGAALATAAVDHWQHHTTVEPDPHRPQLAAAFTDQAIWLTDNGDRTEGLAASTKAVAAYEELAKTNRAVLPELAGSINNLAGHLVKMGRREEALASAERAVGFYEELVQDNRSAHLPDLAGSVHNLAAHLLVAGRHDEALAASERAVAMRAVLAESDFAAHFPELAGALDNFATHLSAAGRYDEALAVSERAVGFYEELVEGNRAAYLPDLARSVGNYALRLAEVGQWEEALAASERAVGFYEELVEGNRAAYLPDLARSVNNHANRLVEVGRRDEARVASERAVGFYEDLVEGNRAAYLSDLAGSVNNLATYLAEVGRQEEAFAACERAVGFYEDLVEGNRAAYLPDLARSVGNYAVWLAGAGRRDEALAASERALAMHEELAQRNRAAYLPDLARSVSNYALRLAEVGQWEEALAASEGAVDFYEELVERNRAAYLPDLARSVHNHAVRLAGAGQRDEVLAAASERAVGFYEELVEGNRAAYLPSLAQSLLTAAWALRALNVDNAVAVAIWDRAIRYYRELAEIEPAAFADHLANIEDLREALVADGAGEAAG